MFWSNFRFGSLGVCLAILWIAVSLSAPPVAGQEPEKKNYDLKVASRFRDAYTAKDWPNSIKYGLQLARLNPGEQVVEYNLACVYAMNGESKEAFDWLLRSAEHGFFNLDLFQADPDLKSLHGQRLYLKAERRIRKNYAAHVAELQQMADDSEPVIVFPEGCDPTKPRPVIVALHPNGGTPETFAACWVRAAAGAGAILVAPRAIHPVGLGFEWGSIEDANMLIVRALERVKAQYAMDEQKVILTGFSQGGRISFCLGMRYPNRFRGVIPVAGEYSVLSFPEPEEGAKSGALRPRFFLMVGANDKRLMSNERAYKDLTEAGVEVRLRVYPDLGHCLPDEHPEELSRAIAFVME